MKVYFTAAAQNPSKCIKFDFYFMHCLNCAIFFWSFLEQPWLSDADKARLLEWKGRTDLAMYASRRAPVLHQEDINQYRTPGTELSSRADRWRDVFERVSKDPEDGHASKLVRTLAWSEKLSVDFEQCKEFAVKGDMWLKIAHMGEVRTPRLHVRLANAIVQSWIQWKARTNAGSGLRDSKRRG